MDSKLAVTSLESNLQVPANISEMFCFCVFCKKKGQLKKELKNSDRYVNPLCSHIWAISMVLGNPFLKDWNGAREHKEG